MLYILDRVNIKFSVTLLQFWMDRVVVVLLFVRFIIFLYIFIKFFVLCLWSVLCVLLNINGNNHSSRTPTAAAVCSE